MDKNNSEAHSPCAKFNYFQLTSSDNLYHNCLDLQYHEIYEDQRDQKSRKGRKRPENGVTSATIR